MKKWADNIVAHPSTIVSHSVGNICAITGGLKNAFKAYSDEQYDEAGDFIGEVLVDMLGKV